MQVKVYMRTKEKVEAISKHRFLFNRSGRLFFWLLGILALVFVLGIVIVFKMNIVMQKHLDNILYLLGQVSIRCCPFQGRCHRIVTPIIKHKNHIKNDAKIR